MQLSAIITAVKIGTDALDTVVTFTVADGDDTQMVAFTDSINQAHACFLVDHTAIGTDQSAYAQLVKAITIATNKELLGMVNSEFTSVE